MSDDDDKLKQLGDAFRSYFMASQPLPLTVQPIDEHGNTKGPPITTFTELHASGAFADPVRDALAEAKAAVAKAEEAVRARYLANTNNDANALRPVLRELIQAHHHTHTAIKAWKPYEYPREQPSNQPSTPTKKEEKP